MFVSNDDVSYRSFQLHTQSISLLLEIYLLLKISQFKILQRRIEEKFTIKSNLFENCIIPTD